MVIRIVKMTFLESNIDDFKEFVKTVENTIRNFEGCEHLDILQDLHNRNIFFSYSMWKSEEDLDNYRKSGFFNATWAKVRKWFGDRPRAWSVEKL